MTSTAPSAARTSRRLVHRGGPDAEALGRSPGGSSTEIPPRAEGGGGPLTCVVTAGQRHESVAFARVLEHGAVKRPGRGRPRQCPKRVVADKGYRNRQSRRYPRRRGIRDTIPRKRNERRTGPFDRQRYRARHRVARLITRLKPFRRVATRYETRAIDYTGMLTLATSLLWL